ncbi:hypothetical protein AMATHDRAFT_46536 [Amanita thiersii Skay4041]|uniref:Clathrin light chain n=1 Tax=Amanita thiersii Skay4041 TaxID=703135 RepID=A0A2A9NNR4_9AGAR|nr:hypothetical protein AMATHDRAFT_46536 [Amanita thiersii Skay4041]
MSDLFGGDEIDFERAASAFPDISLDGDTDIPIMPAAPPAGRPSSGFSFDRFDAIPAQRDTVVKVTGDDEIEKFESEFPDIDVGYSQPTATPPVAARAFAATTFAPKPQSSLYSSTPILSQAAEEDEPEVIRAWREKQQEEIRARDEASKARRQETISKAERAIDEFYEDYAKKKERNIRENKEQEAAYIASLTESLSVGTTWERICDLIELQNSQSKTIARTGPGTTDLSRFKEVLLRLKREGDAAPGAAGY